MTSDFDHVSFARAWHAYWTAPSGSEARNELQWIWEGESDLIRLRPFDTLQFIRAVVNLEPEGRVIAVLAAGPMEDVLAEHGPAIIDTVEAIARQDPPFAAMLGGVWQNGMREDIWKRVQEVWDRRGWDGNPS